MDGQREGTEDERGRDGRRVRRAQQRRWTAARGEQRADRRLSDRRLALCSRLAFSEHVASLSDSIALLCSLSSMLSRLHSGRSRDSFDSASGLSVVSPVSLDSRCLTDYYSNKHKYEGAGGFSFGSSSSSSASKADSKKLTAIFDSYASAEDKDVIDGAKLASFFGDLGVDVSGPAPLALAWQYKCANFATVERAEFMSYYSAKGIDTLAGMKTDAKRVTDLLSDKAQFKAFYRWLFDFVKEEEERKTIDNNMAFSLWAVVLPVHWSLTSDWLSFCKSNKSLKMVSQDLWGQLWEFVKDCKSDLSNYDDDGQRTRGAEAAGARGTRSAGGGHDASAHAAKAQSGAHSPEQPPCTLALADQREGRDSTTRAGDATSDSCSFPARGLRVCPSLRVPSGSWPVLIDEFVEHQRKVKK